MNHPTIFMEGISFGYGAGMFFDKVSLELEGGFVSIIGPNGSGKSTLMKLMTGLLTPTSGSVKFEGRDIMGISPNERARLFTSISQKQFFPMPFTCMEFVALGRYPYRRNLNALGEEDYSSIVESMKAANVLQFKDRLITDISGGEQQRVLLASAIAQDTKVIFLDEAFSALDISHKAHMVKLLKNMVEEKSVMVVSVIHDLNIAYRYSDKVCIVENGGISGYGPPREVMTRDAVSRIFEVNVELVDGKGFYIDI